MSLLVFDAVHFAYGERTVLREVSLEVRAGEIVGLVGPNGAGKSTLLRVASGWLVPAAGSVRLDGAEVHRLSRREAARRIAGVGSEEDVRFPFTVRDTVALGRHPWRGALAQPSEHDRSVVEAALGAVELAPVADRALPTLSSGERQRALLARCLAQGGELLLLDEPTAHLDLGRRERVLAHLARRARAHNQAVLAALHDLNLAAGFADRIVLLVEGRIQADGRPQDVLVPDLLERAFGARVRVLAHPTTGTPIVVSEPIVAPAEGGAP